MAPDDDGTRQIDEARRKLLEEIKRRAEEAELRRLEDEATTPVKPSPRPRQEQKHTESAPPKPTVPLSSSPDHGTPESHHGEASPEGELTPEETAPPHSPAEPVWNTSFQEPTPAGTENFAFPENLMSPYGEGQKNSPGERGSSDEPPVSAFSSPVVPEESMPSPDARVAELREQFSRAIDLRDSDSARNLLEECSASEMELSEVTAMRLILERLEEDLLAEHRVAEEDELPHVQESHPSGDAETPAVAEPDLPRQPRVDPQQVIELMHQAEFNYQHERYSAAMDTLVNLLAMDPDNEEARNLQREVQRAHDLSERIAQEDARSRETLNAPPVPVPGEKSVPTDVEVWGSSVKPFGPSTMEPAPEQEMPHPVRRIPKTSGIVPALGNLVRIIKPFAIVVLVAAIVAVGYYLVRRITSAVVPSRASIIILPTTTTGGDPSLAQLADGFSDDVIRKLGLVADLRVIAPASSYAAAGLSWSPPQTAREVGVGLCLTWNVSNDSSGFHVHQALFDSSKSTPVWSKSLTFPDSILNVERSEVLDGLLTAAGVRANEEEQVALHKLPTTNGEAYRSYLRGRSMLRHRDVYPLTNAAMEFERAIAFDSLFADAYAALGWCKILSYEREDTSGGQMADAIVCVQRAVSLGFRNGETFRAWGAIERNQGHFEKASERFEQAIQIAPSDADARRRLAVVQSIRGEIDRAISSAKLAVPDDPLNSESYIVLGLLQKYAAIANNNADDFASALTTFRKGEQYATDRSDYASKYIAEIEWYLQNPDGAVAILSDHVARTRQSYESLYMLGRVQQAAGRPKQEWEEILARSKSSLQAAIRAKPGNPLLLSWLSLIETRLGEFKEALANARLAMAAAPRDRALLYNIARMYALQRNSKESVDYLRKAVDQGYDLAAVLDMDFFNLHGEQAYLKAIER